MGVEGNLLDPLTDEHYAALKADIARRGCLVPVEVCARTGRVLDGHHRLRACSELGVKAPVVERDFPDDTARDEHALLLNMVRRQLGPIAWANAFDRLLTARGVSRRRGPKRGVSATVAEIAAELGVSDRTARNRLRTASELRRHPDLAARVDAGRITAQTALHQARRRERADLPAPDMPVGEWPTIVADPPWRFDNDNMPAAAENHYPTLSVEQLGALSLPAPPNAHLYLWTTNSTLASAFELVDAWGYEYKTLLTWVKPQMGLGSWFRNSTEHVLFAARGSLPLLRNDLRTWFQAPRTRHSVKPGCFYELVEQASPGPYLDLFARRRRSGWEAWGNAVEVALDSHH